MATFENYLRICGYCFCENLCNLWLLLKIICVSAAICFCENLCNLWLLLKIICVSAAICFCENLCNLWLLLKIICASAAICFCENLSICGYCCCDPWSKNCLKNSR